MKERVTLFAVMFSIFSMASSMTMMQGTFAQKDVADECSKYSGEWNEEDKICENFKDVEKAEKFVDILCGATEDYKKNRETCDQYYDMLEGKKLFTTSEVDRCTEYTGKLDGDTGMCVNFTDEIKAAEFVNLLCDASEDYENNKVECDQYYDMLEKDYPNSEQYLG